MEKPGAGSEKMGLGPVKLDGRGPQALDAGRISVSSIPSRKELWACSGPKGLLAGVSKVLAGAKQETKSSSCDPSLECVPVSGERGTQGHPEGSFSPVGSAAAMGSNTFRKNKVPHPLSGLAPRSPGCLGTLGVSKVPGGQVLGEAPWIQNSP